MKTYSASMALHYCSFCKRPFLNGEVFGIVPEEPSLTACDKCAEHHYKGEKTLLVEVHLTGEPIQSEEEILQAKKAVAFFRYLLTTDTDPRIDAVNPVQRAYLEERLTLLLEALGGIQVGILPPGRWGTGNPTR